MLVTVRRGKTNPEGETKDVRFVKGDVACALRDAAVRLKGGTSAAARAGPALEVW